MQVLSDLVALGHSVAVDDFGTGYSSLSRLAHMPVNALKVDRAFIDGIDEDDRGRALVEGIVSMSRALGLKVIAEGMESEAQLGILDAIGCDTVQGYYFYRPMGFDAFTELLGGGLAVHHKQSA